MAANDCCHCRILLGVIGIIRVFRVFRFLIFPLIPLCGLDFADFSFLLSDFSFLLSHSYPSFCTSLLFKSMHFCGIGNTVVYAFSSLGNWGRWSYDL